jgi:hypothetical protein
MGGLPPPLIDREISIPFSLASLSSFSFIGTPSSSTISFQLRLSFQIFFITGAADPYILFTSLM